MTLLEFLQKVSVDENYLNEFTNDPDKTMSDAGLSEDEKSAVKSADREKIAALVEPHANLEAAGLKVKVKVKLDVQVEA